MVAAINAAHAAKARGLITLRDLCHEYSLDPPAARIRLRHHGIKPTDGAYPWERDSDALTKAREVLQSIT